MTPQSEVPLSTIFLQVLLIFSGPYIFLVQIMYNPIRCIILQSVIFLLSHSEF